MKATRSQSNGHTEIDLSWLPPNVDSDGKGDGDGFGVITKYVVEQSRDRSSTWEPLVTLAAKDACGAGGCKYTHTGLLPGQAVRYRVQAVNVGVPEKMSDWSDTATLTTEKSTKPDRPEGLVAEAMSPTAINLMWNIQSRTPPAAAIVAYVIQYQDDAGDWVEVARIMDADAADNQNSSVRTMYTDTGLAPLTTRTYRVLAENMPAVGETAVSAESERATATTMDAMVPGAPTGVTATADSPTAVTVSWTAPEDNGGTDITGYKVMWKMSDADAYADADMATAAADATSHQVTGLTEMTAYAFKVMATNAKGDSEASAEATATTGTGKQRPRGVNRPR